MSPTRSLSFVPGHRTGCAEAAVVAGADALILHLEDAAPQDMAAETRQMTPGKLACIIGLETEQGHSECAAMLAVSPRCATPFAGTARDADMSRWIGFAVTPDGLETLYPRSRAFLMVRAAGRDFPLAGLWQGLRGDDGAGEFMRDNEPPVFRGIVSIHPRHVEMANRVLMLTEQEVVCCQGTLVDLAHVNTARDVNAPYPTLKNKWRTLVPEQELSDAA